MSPVAAAIAGEARASAWAFSCVFDIIETVDALALTADVSSIPTSFSSGSFSSGGWLDLNGEVCGRADSAEPARCRPVGHALMCLDRLSLSTRGGDLGLPAEVEIRLTPWRESPTFASAVCGC